MSQSGVQKAVKSFRWTLLVTFAGVALSIFASYVGTRTFDPVTVLMGLLISLMVAIVTSRYEEMKNNFVTINKAVTDFSQLYDRLEKLIRPMIVEQTSRLGVYDEALKTLRNFINQHKEDGSSNCGSLLVIQRTPSPVFHSDLQKEKPGYREEKDFTQAIFEAIALAKKKKIKMVYAFPANDPKFLKAAEDLYDIDKGIVEKIEKFASAFVSKEDPYENWNYLRLYPLDNRIAQPLMVADKIMEIWMEETRDEIVYVRAVNEEIAAHYFDKYWKLTDMVSPLSARKFLDDIGEKLRTQRS